VLNVIGACYYGLLPYKSRLKKQVNSDENESIFLRMDSYEVNPIQDYAGNQSQIELAYQNESKTRELHTSLLEDGYGEVDDAQVIPTDETPGQTVFHSPLDV
jgi:hypothetical protein